jgi:hypothetical protein
VIDSKLAAHGISVALPQRWEGRIYRRPAAAADHHLVETHRAVRGGRHPGAEGWAGELMLPVTHLGNFALPVTRGDYGSGAVERMGSRDVFVALLEFSAECAGTPLFEPVRRLPRPRVHDFDPNGLQRKLPGQAGFQRFFTLGGRAMCLYVVLGAQRSAGRLRPQLHDALDGIEVDPR